MKTNRFKKRYVFFSLLVAAAVTANIETAPKIDKLIQEEKYHIVLDPNARTKLTARVASPVQKINKKMGDSFKKGDILIQLDDAIFLASKLKAEALKVKADTELTSKKALFEDESASLFELKEAESNAASAASEVANAVEALDATKIIAPYDGKVSQVLVEEREIPKSGDVLIEVIDDQTLLAKFLADSKLNPKMGQKVFIDVNETGETIEAVITRMSPDIDPSSGTIKVEAEVDNHDGRWKAGMSGDVYFQAGQ